MGQLYTVQIHPLSGYLYTNDPTCAHSASAGFFPTGDEILSSDWCSVAIAREQSGHFTRSPRPSNQSCNSSSHSRSSSRRSSSSKSWTRSISSASSPRSLHTPAGHLYETHTKSSPVIGTSCVRSGVWGAYRNTAGALPLSL